jgi:hypothetical protein
MPKIAQDSHLPNLHRAMLLPLRIRMPELEHLNPAPPKPPTKQFTGQETPQNDIPNHSMAL